MTDLDAGRMRVPRTTLRLQRHAAELLGPAELAAFATIDIAADAGDIELLRMRANGLVIARAEIEAMQRLLEAWPRALARLLLEDGMPAEEVASFLCRIDSALAFQSDSFDVDDAISRILREDA